MAPYLNAGTGRPRDACPNSPNVEGHESRGHSPSRKCTGAVEGWSQCSGTGKDHLRPGQCHASPRNRAHLASTRTIESEPCAGSDLGARGPLERGRHNCVNNTAQSADVTEALPRSRATIAATGKRRRQPPLNVFRMSAHRHVCLPIRACGMFHRPRTGRAMIRRHQAGSPDRRLNPTSRRPR